MRPRPPRIIYLAHDSPGRVRFRLSWLRDQRNEATPIADALSELAGVGEVQVRPFTGSVLVIYDPARTDVATIRTTLCSFTGVDSVTLPGQETPDADSSNPARLVRRRRRLSQAAVKAFQGLNVDVLRMTAAASASAPWPRCRCGLAPRPRCCRRRASNCPSGTSSCGGASAASPSSKATPSRPRAKAHARGAVRGRQRRGQSRRGRSRRAAARQIACHSRPAPADQGEEASR